MTLEEKGRDYCHLNDLKNKYGLSFALPNDFGDVVAAYMHAGQAIVECRKVRKAINTVEIFVHSQGVKEHRAAFPFFHMLNDNKAYTARETLQSEQPEEL